MNPHLKSLFSRRPDLVACEAAIAAAHDLLGSCFRRGGRAYVCGNGGSAADCEHWAGEMLKGFRLRRLARGARLPAELRRLQEGLPMIPLTGFVSLRTAVANDIDAALEFAQLVWALGQPGDVLIGISTGGNARNVLLAARAARVKGMSVIGFTGATGGKLRRAAEPCIRVPADETFLIQEGHLAIYHAISLALEEEFFGNAKPAKN